MARLMVFVGFFLLFSSCAKSPPLRTQELPLVLDELDQEFLKLAVVLWISEDPQFLDWDGPGRTATEASSQLMQAAQREIGNNISSYRCLLEGIGRRQQAPAPGLCGELAGFGFRVKDIEVEFQTVQTEIGEGKVSIGVPALANTEHRYSKKKIQTILQKVTLDLKPPSQLLAILRRHLEIAEETYVEMEEGQKVSLEDKEELIHFRKQLCQSQTLGVALTQLLNETLYTRQCAFNSKELTLVMKFQVVKTRSHKTGLLLVPLAAKGSDENSVYHQVKLVLERVPRT